MIELSMKYNIILKCLIILKYLISDISLFQEDFFAITLRYH